MSQINKFTGVPTGVRQGGRPAAEHFCEYCQVWMKNHPRVIQMHEQAAPHKAAVSKKLHELRVKAVKDKEEEASLKKSMAKIEATAAAQYEADQAAAAAAKAALGAWETDESGYFYNAVQRYYYNKDNGMYYGGEPAAWTTTPAIPDGARFEHSAHAQKTAGGGAGGGAGPGPSSKAPGLGIQRKVIEKKAHPLAGIGGFSAPVAGLPGAGRGASAGQGGSGSQAPAAGRGGGRGGAAKPLSKEEAEALAKREAARQRVAQRSAAFFGM